MKKSLIIMILLVVASTVIYAGGAKKGKNSSFGQWDYDKFPAGTQVVGTSNAPSGYNSSDSGL